MPSEFRKVIFLDIEGVVVTNKSILANFTEAHPYQGARVATWHKYLDKACLGLVFKLAKDYGAKIVLSSMLRNDTFVHSGLIAAAPAWVHDIPNGAEDLISLAVTKFLGTRTREIKLFITEHEVEKYVVFDDNFVSIPNFISVEPRNGLSLGDYEDARHILADAEEEVKPELIFL